MNATKSTICTFLFSFISEILGKARSKLVVFDSVLVMATAKIFISKMTIHKYLDSFVQNFVTDVLPMFSLGIQHTSFDQERSVKYPALFITIAHLRKISSLRNNFLFDQINFNLESAIIFSTKN